MESFYSENQAFSTPGSSPATIMLTADLTAIEPNLSWLAPTATAATAATVLTAQASQNQVYVQITGAAFDGYVLNTTSKSGTVFTYMRDVQAKTAKCKALVAAVSPATCGAIATW